MTRSKEIKIIIAIVCISFIQGLQFSLSPVLGAIQAHYSTISVSLVQMLITAPAILSMPVALLSGWLVTKISKKKLLFTAGLITGITGFLPLLTDCFELLFISRVCYGIGLGLATALNTAVVAEFFEGNKRIVVMGIQASSIGAGMVIITSVSGILGSGNFKNSYFVNVIGFIAMFLIGFCLPDTKIENRKCRERIRLNGKVAMLSVFGFFEYLFLITFTTNIAIHIGGDLAGNPAISGTLTGIFSGVQIVMGLILSYVTKITKKMTLPAAMLSFSIGAVLLIFFPDNFGMLVAGALFCGASQGMFIPQAMVDVAGAVKPIAAAMAAACFTCAMSFGQLISPTILNTISKAVFGEVTTGNVYRIAAAGMAAAAVVLILIKMKEPVDIKLERKSE